MNDLPSLTPLPLLPRLPARRPILLALWAGLVIYPFIWGPPNRGTTMTLVMDATFFRTDRVEAGVVAIFNLLGVWPALYACVLLANGKGRRLPAWPFVLLSCFVGAFALLPYLALCEDDGRFLGARRGAVRFFDSRFMGLSLLIVSLLLVGIGLIQGDLARYAAMFKTDSLVHIMTLDFVILCLVFPTLLASDMERRGLRNRTWFWLVACVPMLGPAAYVALRPELIEATI